MLASIWLWAKFLTVLLLSWVAAMLIIGALAPVVLAAVVVTGGTFLAITLFTAGGLWLVTLGAAARVWWQRRLFERDRGQNRSRPEGLDG